MKKITNQIFKDQGYDFILLYYNLYKLDDVILL